LKEEIKVLVKYRLQKAKETPLSKEFVSKIEEIALKILERA